MRFKQFLAEYAGGVDLDTACSKIRRECKYFLKASKGKALYRGMKGISEEAGVIFAPAPKNRSPKDSSPGFNIMFNAGFDLAYDFKNIRQNCMYATGSFTSAKVYGPTYFIFPKGTFSWVFSPDYEDSYEDSGRMYGSLGYAIEKDLGIRIPSHELSQMFEHLGQENITADKFIAGGSQVDDALEEAMMDSFTDEEIAAVKNLDLNKILVKGLKTVFEQDYIDSEDLNKAIGIRHEIGFYGFEGYYAVPTLLVYQMLKLDKSELGDRFAEEIPEAKYDPSTLYPYLLNLIDQA
jgi:hypothetical protein